jgi:hypothetical protein
MQEYHFTLEYDDFKAGLVLGGKWTLYNFAEFLLKTVGFDFDHPFEFCDNLKRPYRSEEIYSLIADLGGDADDPGVQNTLVSEVFKARKKMVFHFDYGADWYFLITCTAVKESPAKRRFKKLLAIEGKPPVQYPDCEDEE